MDLTSLTPADLKHISALIERKGTLSSELQRLDAELANYGSASALRRRGVGKTSTAPRGRRGQLKEAIIGLLKAAGKAGITVKEIAGRTGRNPANIYTWFFTTGKKMREIKKLDGAKYAWAG